MLPWRGWSRRAPAAPGHRGRRRGSTGRTGATGGTAGGEEQVGVWWRRSGGQGRRPQRKRTCFSFVFRVVITSSLSPISNSFFFYEKILWGFPLSLFVPKKQQLNYFIFFSLQDTIFFSPIWTMTTTTHKKKILTFKWIFPHTRGPLFHRLFAVPTGNFTRLKSATPQGHIRESCSQPL